MPTQTISAQKGPLERDNQKAPDTDNNEAMGVLNSPKLDNSGKPTQRAVTTAKQAWTIAKRHRDTAVAGRIKKAAIIAAKYNGDAPFQENELKATGQSWRNNFSTNFLASLIDRVTPQLTDPANKSDLLTHAQLPANYPDGATKSRKFQEKITKTIRGWNEWKDFLSGLSKEETLYGNACPARIDSNWRPRLWGYGESFLPEGTGQHSSKVQVAVFYQPLLLHEFIQLFQDPKIAKGAGYNIEGCVKVANRTTGAGEAGPKDPTELDRQDVIREGGGIMGWSYQDPNRTVNLMHVMVRDYSGEVDLWTVDAGEGVEIRHQEGLHKKIDDGICLFTFQSGNRKYYGSKGLGRLEANLHTAIERGRNLGADQMYLSGLIIWEGDPKDSAAVQCKVRHPFVIVKTGTKLVEQQIVFNAEAFDLMDRKLVSIAESIAGAFIPPNLEGEGSSNTKIEAAQKAERDIAVREGVLGRFFDQLSELVGMMQRGICLIENIKEAVRVYKDKTSKLKQGIRVIQRAIYNVLKLCGIPLEMTEPTLNIVAADEEAVNALVELMEDGLTAEEIIALSMEPAGASNSAEGAEKDNRTIGVLQDNKLAPSPFIDQRKAEEMRVRLLAGEDRAATLIIPEDDPSVKARATNSQIMEISEMIDGNAMGVPMDDNHVIHREALAPRLGDVIHAIEQAPTTPLIKAAGLMLDHYMQHLKADKVTPEQAKQQEAKVIQSWGQVLDKAQLLMQKQQQRIEQLGGKMGPDGSPLPIQGRPMQVGPNGQMIGEGGAPNPDDPTLITPDHQIKAAATAADMEARKTDQVLTARKLALDEQKHAHQVNMDTAKLGQTNLQMLQGQAQHVDKIAQTEADRDLQREIANNPAPPAV